MHCDATNTWATNFLTPEGVQPGETTLEKRSSRFSLDKLKVPIITEDCIARKVFVSLNP